MATTNLDYLRSICDNDLRFMREMIITFLEMTPMLIAQMQILSKEEKWKELGKTAHQLKPSLQFMGMEPAREKVKELEELCSGSPDYLTITHYLSKIERDCNKAFSELNNVMNDGMVSIK